MKILLMGTGPFAVPSARALLHSQHEVLGLVTRPVPLLTGRRKPPPNAMRELAEEFSLKIWDPENVNDPETIEQLRQLDADLFVVCDYGQILSNQCLGAARFGGINLHGSLLPKYRGAAPINWAIYHGEEILGVSVIHMTPRLDGGPVIATAAKQFEKEATAIDVEAELSRLGIDPVLRAINKLVDWDGETLVGDLQDQKLATKAPRLTKSDGIIDWTRSAQQIQNQVRAFQPWPGTYTYLQQPEKPPLRLQIHKVDAIERDSTLPPGQVSGIDKNELLIATGQGLISVLDIQPAGKRVMPVGDFLRGNNLTIGDVLNATSD
jgi:methionyl-tRNA formyltransferase